MSDSDNPLVLHYVEVDSINTTPVPSTNVITTSSRYDYDIDASDSSDDLLVALDDINDAELQSAIISMDSARNALLLNNVLSSPLPSTNENECNLNAIPKLPMSATSLTSKKEYSPSAKSGIIQNDEEYENNNNSIPKTKKKKRKSPKSIVFRNESTCEGITGGNPQSLYNQIINSKILNERNVILRNARKSIKRNTEKHNIIRDLQINDNVLFYSKVDEQYIPGIIQSIKKDKNSNFYRIQKKYVSDEYYIQQISKGSSSTSAIKKEMEELMKFRELRSKKSAMVKYEHYFKVLRMDDFQCELSIALLKQLRTKLKDVVHKQNKVKKYKKKYAKVGKRSDKIADQKHRIVKSMDFVGKYLRESGITLHMSPSPSPVMYKYSQNTRKRVFSSPETPMPDGNIYEWGFEKVSQWLLYISTKTPAILNSDDEEQQNILLQRRKIFSEYMQKFINIDGQSLSKLDKQGLEKIYVLNIIDKRILMNELDLLFEREQNWNAMNYEIMDTSKMDEENNDRSNDLFAEKLLYRNTNTAAHLRKKKKMNVKRNKTYSEIILDHEYNVPSYAMHESSDSGILDDRSRFGGAQMDFDLLRKESKQLLRAIRGKIPLPPHLETKVEGYNTRKKRYTDIMNYVKNYIQLHPNTELDEDLYHDQAKQMARKQVEQELEGKRNDSKFQREIYGRHGKHFKAENAKIKGIKKKSKHDKILSMRKIRQLKTLRDITRAAKTKNKLLDQQLKKESRNNSKNNSRLNSPKERKRSGSSGGKSKEIPFSPLKLDARVVKNKRAESTVIRGKRSKNRRAQTMLTLDSPKKRSKKHKKKGKKVKNVKNETSVVSVGRNHVTLPSMVDNQTFSVSGNSSLAPSTDLKKNSKSANDATINEEVHEDEEDDEIMIKPGFVRGHTTSIIISMDLMDIIHGEDGDEDEDVYSAEVHDNNVEEVIDVDVNGGGMDIAVEEVIDVDVNGRGMDIAVEEVIDVETNEDISVQEVIDVNI